MAALPLEAVVPNSVPGAVHDAPNAVGLAVILTNDYSTEPGGLSRLNGALQDGQALSSAFTKLKFAVCWVRNANRHSLGKILSDLRNLKFSAVRNYRCILFIFAGHGCEGDCLYMQDGLKFQVFSDIIDPLLPKNSKEIGNIEKVFLIDACRGSEWTPTSLVPRSAGLVRGGTPLAMQEVAQEGGFMLAYSTLPRSKAFEDPHNGGLWFSILARLLREKRHLCSVDNLLTQVNAEMKRKMHGTQFQQPERLSRLNKIICLNPECCSCTANEPAGSGFGSLMSAEGDASTRPGAMVSRPANQKQNTDALNMQGHFRGVLNNYHQTGVISQPEFVDDELNNVFHSSITVKIVTVSPVKVTLGKGSSDKNKATAREAAARDACNKIEGAITANGRGVSAPRASQPAIKTPSIKKTSGVAASISPPPAVKKAAATSNPPPAKKKNPPDIKSAKSKLKEYFDARGLTDKDTVKYDTKPAAGGGFVCTVTCPSLRHPAIGERCNKKQEAEHRAAQKALDQLLLQ